MGHTDHALFDTGVRSLLHHGLHGRVFLDAALGKLLPQGERQLHFTVRFFEHIRHGGFGE